MRPDFLTTRPADMQRAVSLLRGGQLVAMPTETVYGLAAHALDAQAVRSIFTAKGRPANDPLIVHVSGKEQAAKVAALNPLAEKLMAHYWPGPLTLVLPKQPCVPPEVTAGLDTVAVRSPAHPVARQLLELSGLPLAAPSANPFGYISPTRPEHVRDSLGEACPPILDGGACTIGLESTILDIAVPERPRLLRPGPITHEELEAFLGCPVIIPERTDGDDSPQAAPGMLSRHYSPRTPLALLAPGQEPPPPTAPGKRAWILLARPIGFAHTAGCQLHWFSETGDLAEVARNAFAKLRELDRAGFTQIYAETPPPEGIGTALRDRLQRAAAKG